MRLIPCEVKTLETDKLLLVIAKILHHPLYHTAIKIESKR